MIINLEEKVKTSEVNSGDVVMCKSNDGGFFTLLFMVEERGLSGDFPFAVCLEEHWVDILENEIDFSDNDSLMDILIKYIKHLDAEIIEILPCNEVEIRRI